MDLLKNVNRLLKPEFNCIMLIKQLHYGFVQYSKIVPGRK
jgi:hypothetical protein